MEERIRLRKSSIRPTIYEKRFESAWIDLKDNKVNIERESPGRSRKLRSIRESAHDRS